MSLSAAAHLQLTRAWCNEASICAGVPEPLQLLPSLPVLANPAWCRAPSFAAAAALLVPPSGGGSGSNGSRHDPSAADLTVAAAVARSAGLGSRMLWALGCQQLYFVYCTPYDHLVGLAHRQVQLLPMTLAKLPAPRSSNSSSGNQSAAAAVEQVAEQRRQAERIFLEVAADQRAGGLRLLGWMLSHLFRWLFNSELYVDVAGLARLRQLYQQGGVEGKEQGGASIVYIPAHKSHLDYLMLSYVLFGAGLPCPHIAAGANLRLPLVGRLLRACGAFFIRRTSRGAADSHLYKSVLSAYVHTLLQAGHSLEFFIEGGRSRDGRVNPPKLGMLRMVVDAVAAGDVARPVYLVPTAMTYDAVIEDGSLAAQLAGAAKKCESLAGLAGTCWGILANALRSRWRRYLLGLGSGGYCGRATVAFGQPISLQQWLEEHQVQLQAGGASERAAVAALGEAVTAGIRSASVLSSSVLLLGAMFAEQHVPSGKQAQQQGLGTGSGGKIAATAAAAGMEWLADELQQRGAPVVRLPRDAVDSPARQQLLLLHLASMLPQCLEVEAAVAPAQEAALGVRRSLVATLMAHSRLNQLLPWLAPEGLLVAALLGAGGAAGRQQRLDRAALLDGAAWLRCVLAPEIDTALHPAAFTSLADFEPALQRLLASGALVEKQGRLQLADGSSSARRVALLAAALLAPMLATYAEVLRSAHAALAAAGQQGCTHKALCSAAQQRLLALASADGNSAAGEAALVVPSSALVQNALRSFAALGVLAPAASQQQQQQATAEEQQQQVIGQPNSKDAEASSPQGPVGEEEQKLLGRAASASSSAGEAEVGGVDEEYAVEPPTPVCSPQPSFKALGAAGGPGSDATSAPTPEGGSPAPQRRSFERRRAARARLQQLGASGGGSGKSGEGASSRSGSDSELDPMAESVAANLCQLDGGSPAVVSLPRPCPPTSQAGGEPVPATEAGAAARAASQHSHPHHGDAPLVLGQSQAAIQQLAQRMGAPLAAFA